VAEPAARHRGGAAAVLQRIALETGVASGPDFVLKWDGKKRERSEWNQDQTLRQAVANSTVW
jgi:beta-lactamase class D